MSSFGVGEDLIAQQCLGEYRYLSFDLAHTNSFMNLPQN